MRTVNTGGTPIGFSERLPGLQLHVSSTTFGTFKRCPRLYEYTTVRGLATREQNVHLVFGSLVHRGIARYELERARGRSHDDALKETLRDAGRATWNRALGRPWLSTSTSKNREGLFRTLVWYLDHYSRVEGLSTVVLASGAPAVEIKFVFDSGYISKSTGENVQFVGTLDRVARFLDRLYVLDVKTTGMGAGAYHAKLFTPGNQFSLYALAGNVTLSEPIAGLFLDAISVGVSHSSFQRSEVPRSEETLDEWLKDSHFWLAQMDQCAEQGSWPMNDTACYGCDFREICSAEPRHREHLLERQMIKKKELQFDEL